MTGYSKVKNLEEVAELFKDGDSFIVSGFYDFGRPETLIKAIYDRGITGLDYMTNDVSTPGHGSTLLVTEGRVKNLTLTFIGGFKDTNTVLDDLMDKDELSITVIPQGTLIERIRCAAYGIGGFYTPTGVGTEVADGKEVREIDGKEYLFEKPFTAKYGLVKAWKADRMGNLRFRGTENNFNNMVARACEVTIVEAEIIQDEPLDPEHIHVPHNFVDYVVQCEIEAQGRFETGGETAIDEDIERIAKRAALELSDQDVVNLGVGIPTNVVNYVPGDMTLWLQSENGLLGMGPAPEKEEDILPAVIDAGRKYVTVNDFGVFFNSEDSFGMIRGGHVDVAILGALEVDQYGNIANWKIPGKTGPGIGGGMDLATGARKLVLTMKHSSKNGSKIKKECTLPPTSVGAVDLIITEMAVLEVDHSCEGAPLILREVAPGYTIEDVVAATDADLNTDTVGDWREE